MAIPFISEEQIEKTAEHLGSSETLMEKSLQEIRESNPFLLGYLLSEDTEAFTQVERDWLLYLALVLVKAVEDNIQEDLPAITEEHILAKEEINWEILQASSEKSFQRRIDPFFENHPQEDLLAFIEDALQEDDEDSGITREGREPLFVMLKTVVDVLISET